jgi:hypothetical protein
LFSHGKHPLSQIISAIIPRNPEAVDKNLIFIEKSGFPNDAIHLTASF